MKMKRMMIKMITITIRTINKHPAEGYLKKVVREFTFDSAFFKGARKDYQKIELFEEELAPDIRYDEVIVVKEDYKKAYNILMDYWDSLPDDEKEDIDKRLTRCGC